jgi:hypothetical protein
LVRQGAFSSFSVNVKSISASSAEVRVRGSSQAEGWIMDFVAIPGLVCALATFLILWLGLLGRGVFIARGFRFAGVAAFLVLVAFLAVAFLLKSVSMSFTYFVKTSSTASASIPSSITSNRSQFPLLPLAQGLRVPTHDKL